MHTNGQTKEVFVFGAGASYGSARTPLGKDLVWKYYEDCSTFYRIENGRPAEDDLKEKRTEFINYGKFLRLADDIFPELDAYNKWQKCMSEGMAFDFPLLRFDKKYYVDEMVRILQDRQKREGVSLIRQLVLEHIGGANRGSNNSLYKEFVGGLIGKSSENLAILSFNFDCLLHEDFRTKIYFDYLINFDEIYEDRRSYNKQNGIPLIKLNGSLDWAICPKCKKIKLLFPHIAMDLYNNLYCTSDKNCQEKLVPFIFLPHEEKDTLINVLWSRARKELEQASKITIIGYSFPYYDKDIINLFRESMNTDAALNIIDYEEDKKKEGKKEEISSWFSKIFPNMKNIKISLFGFQGYINKLNPIGKGAPAFKSQDLS